MKYLFFIILTSFLNNYVFANDFDKLVEITAEAEIKSMHDELRTWNDQEVISDFSKTKLTKSDIKELYNQFKNTIVEPPNPDTYTEYKIDNAKESLAKTELLRKKIHNMLFGLSDELIKEYGQLLHAMRDVLYIDYKHIPLAMKHDNARDIYWFEVHNERLKDAENRYNTIFNIHK